MNSTQRKRARVIGGALITLAITSAVLSHSQDRPRITIYPSALRTGPTAPAVDARKVAEKRPIAFYLGNVRASLFAAPQPTPPTPLPVLPAAKPVKVETKETKAVESSSPPPIDRFEDYVYTGSVTIDGQIEALIENSISKEGWYIKPGDRFQGAAVTNIDAQSVTLNVDGKPRRFIKSTDYNVVPLNANAKGAQTGQGGIGQAGTGQSGAGQPTPGQQGSGDANQTPSRQPGRRVSGAFGAGGFGMGGFGRQGGQGNFGGPGGQSGFGDQGGFGGPGGPGDFGGPGGQGGPSGPGGPGGPGGPPPQ